MYVDHSYYSGTYGGTALDGAAFLAAVRKAETYIRYLTFANGDIFADTAHADSIKGAVCAAAEAYHAAAREAAEGGNVKSESKDGLSVSFIVTRKDGETVDGYIKRCMYQVIREYLLPTGWLRRKVVCGHDHECGCDDHL